MPKGRSRINPAWITEQRTKLTDPTRAKPYEYRTAEGIVLRALVCLLDDLGIPYKILDLGAGVKKVTTDVTLCPKCHGTGRC